MKTTLFSIATLFSLSLSALAADATSAIAVLHPTEGNTVSGTLHFTPTEDGKVKVTGTISGLAPNGEQAFHIHEFGDCSAANGTSAGGHYNPEKHDHALPSKEIRHAGDLGNLKANAEGVATVDVTVDNFTINGDKSPIIGRGVIVHAKMDDGGQPTGNAGARVACGVIGWANPGK
ncbi:MAG: superoxide dismutase family protein [Chthoniobacterales bacterium]